MFKPEYKITEYFLSLVEEIGRLSAFIDSRRVRLPILSALQKEALNRNIHASTSIEGNMLSLEQVTALTENRTINADVKQKIEVLNYSKALNWIILNNQSAISLGLLFDLHEMISCDILEQIKIGVIKAKQNYVVDGKGIVIYTPPEPKHCQRMLHELIDWVNNSLEIHPIIVSAVAHHQFVTIHPFSDGNGRLARIFAQWTLYQKGFDPQHTFCLDEFYALDRQRYYDKIQQARDLDFDFTYWNEYVAEGIVETMTKILERINDLTVTIDGRISLTSRQEELIDILRIHGIVNSAELCRCMSINRARVNQLIQPLVKAGVVVKQGTTKGTKYYLRD